MKKSILLLCIIMCFNNISVFATNIDTNLVLRKIEVRATDTDNTAIPTIQLINPDRTKMIYSDEGVNKNSEYVFDEFVFPVDAQSGEYILRVGENENITETAIKYVSYSKAIETLQCMANDTTSIITEIEKVPELFGTASEAFDFLDDAWKQRIKKEIANISIKYSVEEEAETSILEISNVIKKITNWAKLTESKSSDEIENALKSITNIDLKYIDKVNSLLELTDAFKAQEIDKQNIDENGILSAFDGAVLVSVINDCDWGTAKEVLNYYSNKGLLNIDTRYLAADANVYKGLKAKKILDYRQIPNAMESAYNSANEGTGTGGYSGGGSGSAGGTNVGKVVSAAPTLIIEPQTAEQKTRFKDLDDVSWAKDAIEVLYSKKIVSGNGTEYFNPNDEMTRAEFVKLIVVAFNLIDESANINFSDVSVNDWSYNYIASARKAGIVEGISDEYFGVNNAITRQDMAVIIHRVAKLKKIELKEDSIKFSDSNDISDYAKASVSQLVASKILSGMGNGKFLPLFNLSRAQGAVVIYNLLNTENIKDNF